MSGQDGKGGPRPRPVFSLVGVDGKRLAPDGDAHRRAFSEVVQKACGKPGRQAFFYCGAVGDGPAGSSQVSGRSNGPTAEELVTCAGVIAKFAAEGAGADAEMRASLCEYIADMLGCVVVAAPRPDAPGKKTE